MKVNVYANFQVCRSNVQLLEHTQTDRHTDRQTDRQTNGTKNITSSANAGGKYNGVQEGITGEFREMRLL